MHYALEWLLMGALRLGALRVCMFGSSEARVGVEVGLVLVRLVVSVVTDWNDGPHVFSVKPEL